MPPYYLTEDLPKLTDLSLGAPELWDRYQEWYAEVFKDGALDSRQKLLIGLAVANVLQCPYCIDVATRSCVEQGVSLGEMTEALQVGAAIQAGATLSHGVQMKAAMDRLQAPSESGASRE